MRGNSFSRRIYFSLLLFLLNSLLVKSQEVPILSYSTNENGQAQIEVNSTVDKYYILKVRHHKDSAFVIPTSITLGKTNTTLLVEPLENYPLEHYQVLEYALDAPADTDADGINDLVEYQNAPLQNPINAAPPIAMEDGMIMIENFEDFKALSIKKDFIKWSEFLNGKEFVKFMILDFDHPQVFFINSDEHDLHSDFAKAIGIDPLNDRIIKGQVIYHPTSISNNGTLGTFAFNYSNGRARDFDIVQKTNELLAANMPFINNNFSYFVTEYSEEQYAQDQALYQQSRIPILFEKDIYQGVDYWGLNQAEGFGFFRQMNLDEIPGPRDIVLYESLPNSLPRVGGIMTSVIQTPLSHVNLRAIQNNVPNAFIRNPLAIDSIANLLDQFIYFKVEQDNYFIREATLAEVNDWFEDLRPKTDQTPPLNLNYTTILPLEEIDFSMFDGFGAKCTNIATMRTFSFPEGTIPNGFGIPFYYYREFMKYNNFFEQIETIINNSEFQTDRTIRDEQLKEFRKDIKQASMPPWMMEELAAMHATFPAGTSIRCRSSSNNEDLAGFNGAGLYDSKTQHPDEGHISKSIKQVYASLWNLRAFEERDFHRVDHLTAAMGVLCHPNYSDEKANGVGISNDPLYNTTNTYYLNTQVGEDLITNPQANSIPEEILLDQAADTESGFIVLQSSNLVPTGTTVMTTQHLEQLRDYLSVIHNEFERLYDAFNNENFAMDIEYKITKEDQLIIKQARPWVHYRLLSNTTTTSTYNSNIKLFPNPARERITVQCDDCNLTSLHITNLMGQSFLERNISNTNDLDISLSVQSLPTGIYLLSGFDHHKNLTQIQKFVIE